MIIRTALFIGAALLAGCSEAARINSDNKEEFHKSVISITKKMSREERAAFLDDIALLNQEHGGYKSTVDSPNLRFLAYINGKSPRQIGNEAFEIRRTRQVAILQGEIRTSDQRLNKVLSAIAGMTDEIRKDEEARLAALLEDMLREVAIDEARQILENLIIKDATFSKADTAGLDPVLSLRLRRMIARGTVKFKILNNAEYPVAVDNVVIRSGNEKVLLKGDSACSGLANLVLGPIVTIGPKGAKDVVCELPSHVEIPSGATIGIGGGRVVGVGDYNAATKFPRFEGGFQDFSEARLKNSRAELERLRSMVLEIRAEIAQKCDELLIYGGTSQLCKP